MTGFNSPLKSKEQLEKYTKEQLMDMYFEMVETHKKFINIIFTATPKEFEELKTFYNIINNLEWGEHK